MRIGAKGACRDRDQTGQGLRGSPMPKTRVPTTFPSAGACMTSERGEDSSDGDKRQRFETLALQHLDAAYNLARWLVRTTTTRTTSFRTRSCGLSRAFRRIQGRQRPPVVAGDRAQHGVHLAGKEPPPERPGAVRRGHPRRCPARRMAPSPRPRSVTQCARRIGVRSMTRWRGCDRAARGGS